MILFTLQILKPDHKVIKHTLEISLVYFVNASIAKLNISLTGVTKPYQTLQITFLYASLYIFTTLHASLDISLDPVWSNFVANTQIGISWDSYTLDLWIFWKR